MSLVTIVISAWISEPVASVPMNESIFVTTTTVALIRPMPTPTSRPMSEREARGACRRVTSLATTTPVSVITNANDRSNTRAESGMRMASAARPVIALVLRICLAVSSVGNVSGTQIAKTMMIASQT